MTVPADIGATAAEAGALHLVDEEGAPCVELTVHVHETLDDAHRARIFGPVRALTPFTRGSHAHLRRDAGPTSTTPTLGIPVDHPLSTPQLAHLTAEARRQHADVLLLPLTGAGSPRAVDGAGLVRACLAVRDRFDPPADVVPVALPRRGPAAIDRARALAVAEAYGATVVVAPPEDGSETALRDLLSHGRPVTEDLADATTVRELRRRARPGCAVLFTGLSGAGKSTIARGVEDALLAGTDRTTTLLDGDVVRRMLSSELGFSRADRELNVRRIAYVAAEIAQHGGIALCAPIAPYAAMRGEFRALVGAHGAGTLVVHVATSLDVCERRDRKGLYVRARAGAIAQFTGISDPYEVPDDADVTLDTEVVTLPDAVARVLSALADRGWVTLEG